MCSGRTQPTRRCSRLRATRSGRVGGAPAPRTSTIRGPTELFDPDKLPAFHDPFAGGGALPLEAQRLGLESYASDLNPVAVLINKAMIEIPPKFAGKPPVNPESRKDKKLIAREWKGAQGLAEDVRYYGKWMRDEAEKRIGIFYPKVEITAEMVKVRPDLKQYAGQKLTVIAWLWARTVKSPNPAFAQVDVPLASTFMLSTKVGKEAYVEPVLEDAGYRFSVKVGKAEGCGCGEERHQASHSADFKCLMSGAPDSLRVHSRRGQGRTPGGTAHGDRRRGRSWARLSRADDQRWASCGRKRVAESGSRKTLEMPRRPVR